MYYVYMYKDPVSKDPVYIGKGSGSRFKQHLTGGCNKEFQDFIKSHDRLTIENNSEIVLKTENEDVALSVEADLINSYGLLSEGGTLFNKLKTGSSNTQVVLTQDQIGLLGLYPDMELAEMLGINWSTLRDKRRAMEIPSFKETHKGTDNYSLRFLKESEEVTLYDTNGRYYKGCRRELCKRLGLNNPELGAVLKGVKNHTKGYFTKPSESVTPYTIFRFMKEGSIYEGTYKDFSKKHNLLLRSVRNICTGHRKDLKGWVCERVVYE